MALNLNDLLTPPTEDELLEQFLGVLAAAGFPITAWYVGGVARTLAKLAAKGLYSVSQLVSAIAAGGFNSTAAGAWLTRLAREVYENDRRPAGFAVGTFTLELSSALAGPYTITAGQLWLSYNGRRYRNTSGGTLTYPTPLTLAWQAESPGAAYNLPDNAFTLDTPLAGASITASVTTTPGTDVEDDASLRSRNAGKWGSVGPAANDDGYEVWAREGSDAVSRVLVLENTPDAGKVRVVVASSQGALEAGELSDVQAYLDPRRPLCILAVAAVNATEQTITLAGTCRVYTGQDLTDVTARITAAVEALFATVAIGGTARLSDLYAAVEAVAGVESVLITTPAADVALGATSVPVLTNSLAYVFI